MIKSEKWFCFGFDQRGRGKRLKSGLNQNQNNVLILKERKDKTLTLGQGTLMPYEVTVGSY